MEQPRLSLMKESQRKLIWKANCLFTAAYQVGQVAVNDTTFTDQHKQLERQAHEFFRQAGFEDGPTHEVWSFCQQVCEYYTAGLLKVTPFD